MLNWLLWILGVIVVIVLVAAVGFVLYGRENTWRALAGDPDLGPVDLAAPTRVTTPNDALLCSPGLCEGVRVDAALPAAGRTSTATSPAPTPSAPPRQMPN